MPRRAGRAAVLLAALLPAACDVAPEPSGAALYAAHCTDCHGAEGRGDGPLAVLQGGRVPDLSRLSARNGGAFPMGYAIEIIGRPGKLNGRITAMPDFADLLGGRRLRYRAGDGREIDTTEAVLRLARHLRRLQRPAPD